MALDRAGKFLATIVGILKAAKHFIDTCDTKTSETKTSIATSSKMSAESPSLDMFVAAIHEVREAVADPGYNVTTARERLASTKGVNFDSQLVGKLRDLIIDIDNELRTTSCSFPEANTESEKKILIWQTMGFVEFKAFGKSESNESTLAIKDPTASILRDKENEMCVGGSTTGQGKGQAKKTGECKGKNIEPALNDIASGKGMSKEHDTVVEGATIDKGKEKQIESALNNVVNDKSMSKEHDTVVEDATIDKGKEKQIESALDNVVDGKGTSKVHDMLHDMLVVGPKKKKRKGKSKKNKVPTDNGMNGEAKSKVNDDFVVVSTLDKGKGKESELLIEGSATDKGKNKEIGLPPAKNEVQDENNNDDDAEISKESHDLIREAKDLVLEPISDDEDDEVSRIIVEPDSTGQDAHRHEPMTVEARQEALMAFRKIDRLLRHAIRPQTAAPCQLDLFCRFVEDPLFFGMMSETTEELRWNR